MKRFIYIGLILLGFSTAACSDWLDIKPKKMVEEEDLFSRETGFKEALTGVYLKMASTKLYASTLTCEFMDILGQRYQYLNTSQQYEYQNPAYYIFPSSITEPKTNAIWANMYNVIANLNNMLTWIEKNGSVINTPGYYEIIKGEALALRGFLHLDLLRMYGPVYSKNPSAKSICYRTEFNSTTQDLLPANVVMDSIVLDLKRAEALLKDTDPLKFNFPVYDGDDSGDMFLTYRHKRMNLYAVKATLARAYMYAGNKTEAAKYAQEIVNSKQFELITDNSTDRIYSKEIIFSLYVDKFEDKVGIYFDSRRNYVITENDFFAELFNVAGDGLNDIRVREGSGFVTSNNIRVCQKFNQTGMWASTESTMPIIRLPEMYYILAECATDYNISADYLNRVRKARGIQNVVYNDEAERMKNIELEYRKEFYGEGQLWYYYKRVFAESFLHCPVERLTESNYIFHIPDDEYLFNGVIEK